MFTTIITFLAGIFTAINTSLPILSSWLIEFNKAILAKSSTAQKAAIAKGLQGLLAGNQIPIEDAIGTSNAGQPALNQTDVDAIATPPPSSNTKLQILFFFFILLGLGSCLTKPQIEAEISTTDRLPADMCNKLCELFPDSCIVHQNADGTTENRIKFGHRRTIDCSRVPKKPTPVWTANCTGDNHPPTYIEIVSYCSDRSAQRSSMDDAVLTSILDHGTIPNDSGAQ